mmetsp:Transcript_104662/g.223722  ORF Transcript_104662/g.223722 Transcript_104662/m.223722 type:complete len:339 (-) Transcript_104662:894-1910(-)
MAILRSCGTRIRQGFPPGGHESIAQVAVLIYVRVPAAEREGKLSEIVASLLPEARLGVPVIDIVRHLHGAATEINDRRRVRDGLDARTEGAHQEVHRQPLALALFLPSHDFHALILETVGSQQLLHLGQHLICLLLWQQAEASGCAECERRRRPLRHRHHPKCGVEEGSELRRDGALVPSECAQTWLLRHMDLAGTANVQESRGPSIESEDVQACARAPRIDDDAENLLRWSRGEQVGGNAEGASKEDARKASRRATGSEALHSHGGGEEEAARDVTPGQGLPIEDERDGDSQDLPATLQDLCKRRAIVLDQHQHAVHRHVTRKRCDERYEHGLRVVS